MIVYAPQGKHKKVDFLITSKISFGTKHKNFINYSLNPLSRTDLIRNIKIAPASLKDKRIIY